MPAVYGALDVLCLSSVFEGFPNVGGGTMGCGAPCVVTVLGDAAEIVGETGTIVPPRDPSALAVARHVTLNRLAQEGEALRAPGRAS